MFTTIMIILINGINISYCGFSRLQKQNNILEKVQKSIEVKICDEIEYELTEDIDGQPLSIIATHCLNNGTQCFQGRGDWNECNAGERFLCQQAFSRMSIIIDGKTKHIDVPTGCSCLKS